MHKLQSLHSKLKNKYDGEGLATANLSLFLSFTLYAACSWATILLAK